LDPEAIRKQAWGGGALEFFSKKKGPHNLIYSVGQKVPVLRHRYIYRDRKGSKPIIILFFYSNLSKGTATNERYWQNIKGYQDISTEG